MPRRFFEKAKEAGLRSSYTSVGANGRVNLRKGPDTEEAKHI